MAVRQLQLARALSVLPRLASLDLRAATLGASFLAELRVGCPQLTSLAAQDLWVFPTTHQASRGSDSDYDDDVEEDGTDAAAAAASLRRWVPHVALPPRLRQLRLDRQPLAATLAALHPAPPSLELVHVGGGAVQGWRKADVCIRLTGKTRELRSFSHIWDDPEEYDDRLMASAAADMGAAVALLGPRCPCGGGRSSSGSAAVAEARSRSSRSCCSCSCYISASEWECYATYNYTPHQARPSATAEGPAWAACGRPTHPSPPRPLGLDVGVT